MKKSKRALIAKDTLAILKKGHYQNQYGENCSIAKAQKQAEQQTKLYTPSELQTLIVQSLPSPCFPQTTFMVNGLSSLDAVRAMYPSDVHLFCLNFASARNPGGGFLKGSQAQEESIARASGLYPCQLKAEQYYLANRQHPSCLYTDHMIYSPYVPIIKDETGALMDQWITASILTAPAVNAGVVQRQEPQHIDQIESVMKRRIDMVLAIAQKHQHTRLILGAWGCGVFQNDPAIVAKLFGTLLKGKYWGQFAQVVFAIYAKDQRFITPFKEEYLN
ncbi:MAG: TIGR02452 family protein [Bacteroidota bacterium]